MRHIRRSVWKVCAQFLLFNHANHSSSFFYPSIILFEICMSFLSILLFVFLVYFLITFTFSQPSLFYFVFIYLFSIHCLFILS